MWPVILSIIGVLWCLSPIFLFSKWMDARKSLKKLKNVENEKMKVTSELTAELKRSAELAKALNNVSKKLLSESLKLIIAKLTPNNYTSSKAKVTKLVEFLNKNQCTINAQMADSIYADIKKSYEDTVKKSLEKEEQARIKARIKEEMKLEKEIQQELKRLEKEEETIQKALAKALKTAKDEHSSEVEMLKQKLEEAQEKAQRAKSQAQLTRSGYVYVISNIGSFGENVYKVGMTRRLEPLDRVKELGDASVPFSFDVHMMISCSDAPKLENILHKELNSRRVNKVNLRKEFFNVDLATITNLVEKNHGKVEYKAEADAFEFRESQLMNDEDFKYVTSQVSVIDDEPADNGVDLLCPLCDNELMKTTLIAGDNTCPHCQEVFNVEGV